MDSFCMVKWDDNQYFGPFIFREDAAQYAQALGSDATVITCTCIHPFRID